MVALTDRQANKRLLDAVISVSRDLSIGDVLRTVAGYACDLVDASGAAFGIAGPDGTLTDVVYHGTNYAKRSFGELINNPAPVLSDDSLSIPLLIRDEVFGNLQVTAKREGPFTVDDLDMLVTLATAAGIAVENARMYEQSRQRERWLQASNEITAALLDGTHRPADELQLVTERARTVADAPIAAVALPHEDDKGKLVFKVVDGLGWANRGLVGTHVDVAGTASGTVFSTGQPLLIDNYGDRAAAWQDEHNGGAPALLRELGSAAIVPLAAGDQILGVLLLGKLRGDVPFGEPDLELLRNFAAHAALALQYAKARADQRRLAVFEDRERIAGDMQDLVIRRLFDIGLGLEGVSRLVQPWVRARISHLVDDLDGTIRDLRHSIFSLQDHLNPERESANSLDEAVLRTIAQAADALGFEPRVGLAGSLDALVPERIRSDLLATLREALANVARHARATEVSVELRAADDELRLDVLDDGIGIPADRDRHSGLGNLDRRALRWGGHLTVGPGSGGGTRLSWAVPLAWSGDAPPAGETGPLRDD